LTLVRFGIVGLGWAASAFHLPALRTVPGAVVVGGCDPSAEQRAAFERSTGARAYETLGALLADASPEGVVVATPPDSHHATCLEALAAGAHVICEKPFVETVGQADEVIAAADRAGRRVAVNHQYREKPAFRAVLDAVAGGDYGRLVFTQVVQLMDLTPWEEPVAWRREMPNRTLFEGGVHLVDLLLALHGGPPEAVYARHSAGLDPSRSADAVHLVTLEFPGGRLAQITIDRLCKAGTRYIELRADCEEASLRASHGGRVLLQAGIKRAQRPGVRLLFGLGGLAWVEQGTRRRTLARNPRDPGIPATGTLFRKIVAAFERGEEPPSSAREARDTLAVIEAAYRSGATGERVVLGPPLTRP
jgi:predicted dehydrogenase